MTTFLQVLLTGLGLGSAYALFAQGVVFPFICDGYLHFYPSAIYIKKHLGHLKRAAFGKAYPLRMLYLVQAAIGCQCQPVGL